MRLQTKLVTICLALSFLNVEVLAYEHFLEEYYDYPIRSNILFHVAAVLLTTWGAINAYLLLKVAKGCPFSKIAFIREVLVGSFVGLICVLIADHFRIGQYLTLAIACLGGMFNHSFIKVAELLIPKAIELLFNKYFPKP